MAKCSFMVFFIFISTGLWAQNLAQITIDNRGDKDIITFLVDGTVAVNLSKDGNIIEWGLEYTIPQTGMYPRLEKYMGKEEYYPSTDNEAYAGKVKYIGRTLLTYYTSNDNDALKGKVKTIGITMLDYYRDYDNAAFKGSLKSAGSVTFTYYSSFDDQFYKGKIKSIGGTQLSYYGSLDDKAFRGKVKNIDRNVFTYYSSYDRKEYGGMMKSGSQMLSSGGLKYIIKNY
ncbi:MAG: hypothetical protein ABI683_10785 [Ginsengibacter sp.]